MPSQLTTLRFRKVVSWDGSRLQINDWEGLQAIAEFDPTYLCLTQEPR